MSKNLSKSGAYIPGVRPGNDTIDYVSNILSKLTIVGSIFLVIIAGLPIVFSSVSGLDPSITIGGTGLLIVVGVAIETYKQLESSLISRSHRAGIKR
jgi:preprotein translocase subunit SecY